jgi:hypothetical protein
VTTAFQSNAFQHNQGAPTSGFQIDAVQAITGADSWPGDPYKKKSYYRNRRDENEELLHEVRSKFFPDEYSEKVSLEEDDEEALLLLI